MSMTFEEIVEERVNALNDLEWWEFYRVYSVDGTHYDVSANDVESAIEESEYKPEDVDFVELYSYTVKCEVMSVHYGTIG